MEKDFPIFRNYLEEEDDKPYFTMNSLAYYYEDMERKQKLINDMSKLILGYDNKLNVNLEEMEKRIAAELGKWDGKVEELPETVNDLLTQWVEDGSLTALMDTTLLDKKADISLVNTKADVAQVNTLTAQLAETAKKSDLQGISLSYKESYDTLALLQAAYPAGDSFNHTVKADGMIYTYAKGVWTSTGIQANGTGIADGTITLSKVKFKPVNGQKTRNLFDKNSVKMTPANFVRDYNGTLGASASGEYSATDFIEVLPSTTYSINYHYRTAFYDANKTYISGLSNATDTPLSFTTPGNAKYMRTSIKDVYFGTYQLELGSTSTPYEEFGYKVKDGSIGESEIKEKSIPENKLNFPVLSAKGVGKNLFDKQSVVMFEDKFVREYDGAIAASSSGLYKASDFIEVLPNQTYSENFHYRSAFYDANKTYISGIGGSQDAAISFTTPPNAKYIRVTIRDDLFETYQLEYGTTSTPYEPFEKKIAENQLASDVIQKINGTTSELKGKKWGVMGDSNSMAATTYASRKYHNIISDMTGVLVENKALSGNCWSGLQSRGTVHTQLQSLSNDCDLVTIFCGGNDVQYVANGTLPLGALGDSDLTTYYGALEYTISATVAKFPLKKIACLAQMKRGEGKEEIIQGMVKALKDVCGKYGLPVLDLYNGGNIHAYNPTFISQFMPDGVHLNNSGQELITTKIRKFVEAL